MPNYVSFNELKGKYYNELDWKDIVQSVGASLMEDSDLSTYIDPETVQNGVKQFLFVGLPDGKDYKKDVDLKDFNPDEVDMKQFFIGFDFVKKYSVKVPNVNLEQAFSSRANAKAFKALIVDTLTKAIKRDMFYLRMRTLINSKIYKQDGTTDSIVFDSTLTVGDFNTKTLVESGLRKMREHIGRYATLSTQHTNFSKDPKNKNFHATYLPKNMVVVWNLKYYNNIKYVYSGKFDKDDLMLSVPTQKKYAFDLIEKATDSSKMVCFIVHKNAIKEIWPTAQVSEELRVLNFQTVHNALVQYGFGRLTPYPMVKVITSSASRKKRSAPAQQQPTQQPAQQQPAQQKPE